METNQINFNNGAAYERYMGKWSQLVAESFLDWLAPKTNLRWLDVGCGSGSFTETIVSRYAPLSVQGVDPSEAQLAFARTRPVLREAQFHRGDAMALPFPKHTFDVAVMPLVLFFVPVPATGVSEMTRVVKPGGVVSAYSWDLLGGGFPYETLNAELRLMGVEVPLPPSPATCRLDMMRDLWADAGLRSVETRDIVVQRTFLNFEDYWATVLGGPNVGPKLAAMSPEDIGRLQTKMRSILPFDEAGRITYKARANAVKGRVPVLI